jgi:IclR family transcriptional regulator, acetate operon repressor
VDEREANVTTVPRPAGERSAPGSDDAQSATAAQQRSTPPTALSKVLKVLEALGEPTGVSEVARSSGMSVSTAHRILSELTQLGWVFQNEHRQYLPGSRLLAMAGNVIQKSGRVPLARPAMERLSTLTGYTIHLGVRLGDEAVYVEKIDGRRVYQMRSRVGMAIPLHSTAIGKAILAGLPDDDIRAFAARAGLRPITASTITDVEQLVQHLAMVRERGWSWDASENEEIIRCVGMAVYDGTETAIAGISVSGLEYDFDIEAAERLIPFIAEAAEEISRAFGASAKSDLTR